MRSADRCSTIGSDLMKRDSAGAGANSTILVVSVHRVGM